VACGLGDGAGVAVSTIPMGVSWATGVIVGVSVGGAVGEGVTVPVGNAVLVAGADVGVEVTVGVAVGVQVIHPGVPGPPISQPSRAAADAVDVGPAPAEPFPLSPESTVSQRARAATGRARSAAAPTRMAKAGPPAEPPTAEGPWGGCGGGAIEAGHGGAGLAAAAVSGPAWTLV
jgi:hypothetical protein